MTVTTSSQISPYSVPYYTATLHPEDQIEQGEGIYLITRSGHRVIDGDSSHWTAILGHKPPYLIDAIHDQLSKLAVTTNFSNLSSSISNEFSNRLVEEAGPEFASSITCSSGSDAIETAFKFVRRYWGERRSKRHKIICLADAYHGSTLLTEALSCYGPDKLRGELGVCAIQTTSATEEERYSRILTAVREIIAQEGPQQIAAMIMETVPSLSVHCPTAEFYQQLSQILRKNGILLVLDEIVTGMGRIDGFFAFRKYGIVPDIIVGGKGVGAGIFPLSFTILSTEITREFRARRDGLINFGFTHAGNPLGARIGLEVLDHLQATGLVLAENRPAAEDFFLKLSNMTASPLVAEVRRLGQLALLVTTIRGEGLTRLRRRLFDLGLSVREGFFGIYVAPPLCTSSTEYQDILDLLEKALFVSDQEFQQ